MTDYLQALSRWLQEQQVERVALESTGVSGQPVFNIFEEGGLSACLVNPQVIPSLAGDKSRRSGHRRTMTPDAHC
jgi:hypothetical protein